MKHYAAATLLPQRALLLEAVMAGLLPLLPDRGGIS